MEAQQTRENLAAMEALDGIGDDALEGVLSQAMDQAMGEEGNEDEDSEDET